MTNTKDNFLFYGKMTTTKDKRLIAMASKDEMYALVDKYNSSIYYTSFCELSRPKLEVKKIRGQNNYGIYVTWYFNHGTNNRVNGWLVSLSDWV